MILWNRVFTMDKLGMEGWPKEPIILRKRNICASAALKMQNLILARQQMDKDFYIPSAQQIDEICRIGYEASSSAYKTGIFLLRN